MYFPELKEKITNFIEENRQDMLRDLAYLVEVPSVCTDALPGKPFGEAPYEAMVRAKAIAERMGFAVRIEDDVCLTADFGDRPVQLSLMAHLDVVEPGPGWTRPCFEMTREGERVYGRGVTDNKGPAVAILYAMKAVRELCPDLPYSPQAWLGSAEEIGSPDLKIYLKNHKMPKYCLTPDADDPIVTGESAKHRPTFWGNWEKSDARPQVISLHGGTVRNAIPGNAEATIAGLSCADVQAIAQAWTQQTEVEFVLTDTAEGLHIRANGRGAHIMLAEQGRNGQTALIALLTQLPLADCPSTDALHKLAKLFPHGVMDGTCMGLTVADDIMGPSRTNFTVCELNETGFVGKFDSRGPTNATPENYGLLIDRALREAGFTVEETQMEPAHYVPQSDPLVKLVRELYEQVRGYSAECTFSFGATYAHHIEGAFATGIVTPGIDAMLHKADEFLPLDDLDRVVELCILQILCLCGEEAA